MNPRLLDGSKIWSSPLALFFTPSLTPPTPHPLPPYNFYPIYTIQQTQQLGCPSGYGGGFKLHCLAARVFESRPRHYFLFFTLFFFIAYHIFFCSSMGYCPITPCHAHSARSYGLFAGGFVGGEREPWGVGEVPKGHFFCFSNNNIMTLFHLGHPTSPHKIPRPKEPPVKLMFISHILHILPGDCQKLRREG